jgi:glycosyltransferase involved in cell wall biosynthesis
MLSAAVEPLETRQALSTWPRPVRACFLIDELALAGTESQLLALVRRFDRRKVQPVLALLKADPEAGPDPIADCPVVHLGVRKLCRPATVAKLWRFARWLRREQIDVLQLYSPDSTYFGAPAGRLAGVPHVLRVRNNCNHWMTGTDRWLGRRYNRLVTGTLTNCEAAQQAVLRDEGPDPASVTVLANGVDLERFDDIPSWNCWQRPQGEWRVGVVANLRPVKGLDVFLAAAADLAATNPGLTFHLAGAGPLRPALEQQARSLGLEDRVRFRGAVADIPAFLASIDVAVLPSHAEGMSNALLEYLAAGRPVVATAVGAAPDLIEHGKHGLLVPPGSAERLADAVRALLLLPEQAAVMAASARQRVRERHSRAAMIERFERFYGALVFGARGESPDQAAA